MCQVELVFKKSNNGRGKYHIPLNVIMCHQNVLCNVEIISKLYFIKK